MSTVTNMQRPSVATATENFRIDIFNLPEGASWQLLKDWLHKGDGESIDVGHVEVYPNTSSGWIQVKGDRNYRRAELFLSRKKWRGCQMQVTGYPYYSPQTHLNPGTREQLEFINITYNNPSYGGYDSTAKQSPYDIPLRGHLVQNLAPCYNTTSTNESNFAVSVECNDKGCVNARPVFKTESLGVHIGNLPQSINKSEITDFIINSLNITTTEIHNITLPKKADLQPKGYAIVAFPSRDIALRAVDLLDGTIYDGHALKVKLDKDRTTSWPKPTSRSSVIQYATPSLIMIPAQQFVSQVMILPTYPGSFDTSRSMVDTAGDAKQVERRGSERTTITSPPVVDGSKSRLMVRDSTKKEELKLPSSSKGSKDKSRGDRKKPQKTVHFSSSAKRDGEDSKRGKKRS